ncbi:unnamed protein product, partial [Symbiodinium sp. CCMP2456]
MPASRGTLYFRPGETGPRTRFDQAFSFMHPPSWWLHASVECLPPAAEVAKELFGSLGSMADQSGLKKELLEHAQGRATMRLHEDAPHLGAVRSDDFQEKTCCKFAECLCGENIAAARFHANFIALFRPFLRTRLIAKSAAAKAKASSQPGGKKSMKPVPRQLMEQGFLVIKFTKLPPEKAAVRPDVSVNWEQVSEEHLGALQIEATRHPFDDVPPHVEEAIWAHVGFAHYRDWHLTLMLLQEDNSTSAFTESGEPLTVLQVPETPVFLNDTVAFKRYFDLESSWKASFHVIYVNDEMLSEMEVAPCVIEVLRLASVPELVVWKACV